MGQSKSKNSGSYAGNTSPTTSTPPLFTGGILDICCNGDDVISCSDDKRISLLDWRKLQSSPQSRYLTGHTRAVNKVIGRNNTLFSASRDLSVRIWNISSMAEIAVIPDCHSLNVSAIAATNDGTVFASGSRDYSVKIRNTETQNILQEYSTPRNVVTFLKYDHADRFLYQGSEDLCVRVYDSRSSSRQLAKHLTGYVYFPISADVSSDGYYLVTGSKGFNTTGGGEVKLWDLRMDKVVGEFTKHKHDTTGCRFVGSRVISVSKEGSLGCWDFTSGESGELYHIGGARLLTAVDLLETSEDGVKVVVSSFDGSLSYLQVSYSATKGLQSFFSTTPSSMADDTGDD